MNMAIKNYILGKKIVKVKMVISKVRDLILENK